MRRVVSVAEGGAISGLEAIHRRQVGTSTARSVREIDSSSCIPLSGAANMMPSATAASPTIVNAQRKIL
jgi:hypothetical protein